MIKTLSQLFLNTIKSYPKPDFMLYKKEGKYVPISTGEWGDRVKYLALGLKDLGFQSGDKMILLSENSPEWVTSDFASLCLGGISVPIYNSLVPFRLCIMGFPTSRLLSIFLSWLIIFLLKALSLSLEKIF